MKHLRNWTCKSWSGSLVKTQDIILFPLHSLDPCWQENFAPFSRLCKIIYLYSWFDHLFVVIQISFFKGCFLNLFIYLQYFFQMVWIGCSRYLLYRPNVDAIDLLWSLDCRDKGTQNRLLHSPKKIGFIICLL